MQEQERFERYTPQFPLPVDITNMSRQDTVCQFCGVSYLIHTEIKALESKCQKLESDLAHYAGMSSREAALEELLQTERTRAAHLQSMITLNTHKLDEMLNKLQSTQAQLKHSENDHRTMKASMSQCSVDLRTVRHRLQQIQKEQCTVRDAYAKYIEDWRTTMRTAATSCQQEMNKLVIQCAKQSKDDRAQVEHFQREVNESKQSLRNLQLRCEEAERESRESHTKNANNLEVSREKMQLQDTELSRLREHLSQNEQSRVELQNQLEQTNQHCRQLEQQLMEKDQSKKNVDSLLDQYRQQTHTEKELRQKSDKEAETLRSKMAQLTADYEQLSANKKEGEISEASARRKMEETNRTRQAVLDRTRDEYEKLLQKYDDLDEVYRALVDKQEIDSSETELIRHELERLHHDNIELTKQKETMHITHDIQTKKLHDTYSVQLQQAEQWPDRLQTELTREREHHRIQLEELERRLKEGFSAALNIEKEKTNDLLRKYEHDRDHSTGQLRHELISSEKVTIEQRRYYERQIETMEKERSDLKKQLNSLRDVLKELHEQTNNSQAMNSNRGNNLQLKEDLLAKETSLFQARSTVTELKKELDQAREEMITLQETVQKECTEREQLKDALIEARQQLLAMKKNGVLNGTSASRSLHSPPVAFEEIERRVSGPLPLLHSQSQPPVSTFHNKNASSTFSESPTRNSSLSGDAADLMARPMSSSRNIPYRHKTLPPIQSPPTSLPPQPRRHAPNPAPTKAEQLLENQRRIARFIKHIK